jgi:hypothetical protein
VEPPPALPVRCGPCWVRNGLTRDILVSRVVRGACEALASMNLQRTLTLSALSALGLALQLKSSRTSRRFIIVAAKRGLTSALGVACCSLLTLAVAQVVAQRVVRPQLPPHQVCWLRWLRWLRWLCSAREWWPVRERVREQSVCVCAVAWVAPVSVGRVRACAGGIVYESV